MVHPMRRPLFALLSSLAVAAAFVACSDKAALPTLFDNPRVSSCASFAPPDEKKGGSSFHELYTDVFSLQGVAGCVSSTCHGKIGAANKPVGEGGLALVLPSEDPTAGPTPSERGVYCALTTHVFSKDPVKRLVVAAALYDRAAGPARDARACCAPGDALVGRDYGGGSAKDFTLETDGNCVAAVGTAPSTAPATATVVAHCGSDSRAKSVLDELLSPSGASGLSMPLKLGCNANRKLTPLELDRVGRWLARGAPYDDRDGLMTEAKACATPLP